MKLDRLFIIIVALYIFIRILFIHPSFSDENIYFNDAKIVSEGKIPYKDFFLAHPPLQIYAYTLMFKIFGVSFFIGKLIPLITSFLSAFLVFKIIDKLYNTRAGFIAGLIFLIMPGFVAFSTMGYGIWESIFFLLLSTYFIVKNKLREGAISLVIGIFFRYLIILYLPFLILLIYIKKFRLKEFLISFLISFIFLGSSMVFIFGENYINQTFLFHISTKVVARGMEKLVWQYLSMGFFTFFLGVISVYVALVKKNRILLLFSVYPLIIDLVIYFGLNYVAYHYFLISLPFITIATAIAVTSHKDKLLYFLISIVLILSLTSNFQTIDFYLNPNNAKRFYYTAEFIANNTSEKDAIFGEFVMTNYVSFATGRRISSNYMDSDIRHLLYEGEEKVIKNLNDDKPKFFIEMDGYFLYYPKFRDFILNNYVLKENIEGIPKYSIYVLK